MENEKNNQSLVNFGFVLAGFLTYYVVGVLFETLAATFGAVARFRNIEALKHGLPVGLGLLVFLVLFFNPKVQVWADEVISEVKKVVWPSKKDTIAMTVVCCVMCIVAGIGFGVFDFFASQLIKVFVN
jgi:preprotein translocase subunit SecE